MRAFRGVLSGISLALLGGCGGNSTSPAQCVIGASIACTCTDGREGAQVCQSDHSLGNCICSSNQGTGGSGGGGGAAGNAGTTSESCSGCLRFSVPLASSSDGATALLNFGTSVNMSTSTVSFRVQAYAASGGELQLFAQSQSGTGYPGDYKGVQFSEMSPGTGTWTTIVLDVAGYVPNVDASMTFDKSAVRVIGFQILAAGATSWVNPTVVYVDQIAITNSTVGPYNFDSADAGDATGFQISPLTAGVSLTWLGP